MSENREWYVVYTRIGFERKISEYLFRKKIESYCPVNMVVNQQGANKRISRELLFNSYVFARISENMLQQLKKINEVINFMYWQDRPAIILETDIQKIKFFFATAL